MKKRFTNYLKKGTLLFGLLYAGMSSLPIHLLAAQIPRETTVSGQVLAYVTKEPLPGVNILIKGTVKGTTSDAEGNFSLQTALTDTLIFSFIGYEVMEVPLEGRTNIKLELMEDIGILGELEIVSTGYQQVPKERATGSFVQVNEELINRSVSTNVLDRLAEVTPGLIFNRNAADPISIRGRSTLFANTSPLIIVDNFPYDGDINNINPNDVVSITILKDAAAASIWGARAGNGVIVITTKQGAYNQKPQVSFNSNVTIGESPDPFHVPRMSVTDFIATEEELFEAGYYNSSENALNNQALSPLVELLIARRDGEISPEETSARIAELQKHDARNDFEDYLYRESINQQYAVNIKGGGERQRYFLSAGYDHNQQNLVGDNFERFTLNARNTWSFFENKLQLSGDLYYTQTNKQNNGLNPASVRLSTTNALPPYTRLADASGNPVNITQQYRGSFLDEAEANGLLNWRYSPLEEISLNDKNSRLTDFRANFGINYELAPGLDATVRYQYWHSQLSGRDYAPKESYFARDMINRFTQVDAEGNLQRPIPIGGILDSREQRSYSHNLRAQLNYNKSIADKHEINFMGGYELKSMETRANSIRYYGYDDDLANSVPVDHVTRYTAYHYRYSILSIPNNVSHSYLTDRFISYFANASYTFDQRYMVSLSGRKDQSNLFGVEANQRGVPLWSAGVSWNIHEEAFYTWDWLPYLKLRATHGYNGNIDKSVTAFTTAQIMGNSFTTGLLYGQITNPPNPNLQWERVAIQNLGLDFATRNQRVEGSIEYYRKQGYNLIGFAPLAPTTGQTAFKGNTAETEGHGIDIVLATTNINKEFQWRTDWLFSTVNIEVSDYQRDEEAARYLLEYGHNGSSPQVGRPLFTVFSYSWAGLDPQTGDPRGYLNGEVSTEYNSIINNASIDSLVYQGSARPTVFGAVRNTFTWKNFSLSANIGYRLGYYFRRESIQYRFDKGLGGHGDYSDRWQAPGDEAFTGIPSIPETGDTSRDTFYRFSEVLVEKGDHVRLQDINVTYTLDRSRLEGLPFQRLQLYAYVSNLGILWKATDKVADPDYRNANLPRSYALGLKVDF